MATANRFITDEKVLFGPFGGDGTS